MNLHYYLCLACTVIGIAAFQSPAFAEVSVGNATVTPNFTNTAIDLTSEAAALGGGGDWIRWLEPDVDGTVASPSNYDHSSTGSALISTFAVPNGTAVQYRNHPLDTDDVTFSWTNGTVYSNSTSAGISNTGYVYNSSHSLDDKFVFTVSGLGSSGTLKVWVANYASAMTVSVAGYTSANETLGVGTGSWDNIAQTSTVAVGAFYFNYTNADLGDYLEVTLSMTGANSNGFSNVGLHAASVATTVPEPGTWILLPAGIFMMLIFGRRRFDRVG